MAASGRKAGVEAQAAEALARRTTASRLALTAERSAVAFWPLLVVIGFFFAASRLGLWPMLPDWARLALLAGFTVAGAAACWRVLMGAIWPRWREARARLDAGLEDRPVAAFDETIAVGEGDAASSALWRAHRRKVAERALGVRAAGPRFAVGRSDRYHLRWAALAAVALALVLGPRGEPADAFAPIGVAGPGLAPVGVEAWATPPAYTGRPPLYFADADARSGRRAAPEDTVVSLRLFDAGPGARLTVEPADAVAAPPLSPKALAENPEAEPTPPVLRENPETPGAYLADLRLTRDARVTLTAPGLDAPVFDIAFAVTPDRAPEVAVAEAPKRDGDGRLAFSFRGADDYRVTKAYAEILLDETATDHAAMRSFAAAPPPSATAEGVALEPPAVGLAPAADAQEPFVFPLPTPIARFADAEAAAKGGVELGAEQGAEPPHRLGRDIPAAQSFADHAWLGLPVVMTLVVEDAKGQVARSEPLRFTLPGRLFSEPMAKALIEQRGAVAWSEELAPRAERLLQALTRRPDDYFKRGGDYLAVRAAISRLAQAITDEAVATRRPAVLDALYDAASKLEDAGVEDARERLSRAERRLREALERGASDEELAALMRELRAAIDGYLEALRELSERNPELAQQLMEQMGEGSGEFSGDQLQQMLQALEDAARGGQREQAEEMLSMLSDLLDSLRPGAPQQQAGAGQGRPGGQAQRDLEEMIEEQQRQAEESFEADRQRQDGQRQDGQRQDGQRQGQQPGPRDGQQSGQGQTGRQPQGQAQGQGQGDQQAGRQSGSQQGQPGGSAPNGEGERPLDSQSLRDRQQALRERLEGLRDGLDQRLGDGMGGDDLSEADRRRLEQARRDAEEALDQAERAMRSAEEALDADRPGDATQDQMGAVEALREANRASREGLERAEQLARGEDPGERRDGRSPQEGEQGRVAREADPLGRNPQQADSEGAGEGRGNRDFASGDDRSGRRVGDEVLTPREEARRILEDLRRRLGERERAGDELDYLRRLLERF